MTNDKGQMTKDSPCQLALIAPTYLHKLSSACADSNETHKAEFCFCRREFYETALFKPPKKRL
jgi:hypothetical protein